MEVTVKLPPANLSPSFSLTLTSPYSPPPPKTATVSFETGITVCPFSLIIFSPTILSAEITLAMFCTSLSITCYTLFFCSKIF